jgi:3-oxoacyl-[acyl-carrier protein] reductase
MARLKGKVAVVTGASKGIGAAIAERFGEEGASVVVHYASDRKGAEKVVAAIQKAGAQAVAVQGDLSKPEEVTKVFEAAGAAFGGKIDVLVNNAGVYEFRPVAQVDPTHFHRLFDLNVLGLLLSTREAVKHMNGGGGSVINISSVVEEGMANGAVYSATKGAVGAITLSLAKELGAQGIRVNSLQPGPTVTEGFNAMGNGEDFEKAALSRTPLGRLGAATDISGAALFLATEDSRWVTGAEILASGGFRV